MRYGSICSGVEAATLAWRSLGWKAVFFAEVEPFPSAVLCYRFKATRPLRPLDPAMADNEKERKTRELWRRQIAGLPEDGTIPNYGDFTLIKKEDVNEDIDLLVGGTPCQDLSIAGKRLGFEGQRSVLALDFVRLCFELGVRWVVWENVPAALSCRHGEDFGRFVSLLCGWNISVPESGWRKCGIVTPAPGGFGVAWRVLDSQFTRVEQFPRAIPQRRKRLFLIGYSGQWKYPAKVLFDGEMCGGDTPPRRTKRQSAPSDFEGGSASTDWWDGSQKAGTLTRTSDQQFMPDKGRLQCVIEQTGTDFLCYENHAPDSRIKSVEVSQSIVARMGTGGNNLPLLQEVERGLEMRPIASKDECFHVSFCDANGRRKDRPNGGLYVTEAKAGKTVTAGGPGAETVIVEPIALDGDKMKPGERSGGSGMGVSEEGVMYTQTAGDVHGVAYTPSGKPTVRKLLPLECERLMGFPDNHTRIPWNGKSEEECPDAPRYKACGNSMAVNCMMWLGERIQKVEKEISHERGEFPVREITEASNESSNHIKTEEINE
nr:MAG TPA: Cytosine specific methyltransferase [Caudoviricetes sp.]